VAVLRRAAQPTHFTTLRVQLRPARSTFNKVLNFRCSEIAALVRHLLELPGQWRCQHECLPYFVARTPPMARANLHHTSPGSSSPRSLIFSSKQGPSV
jgi:hypothetical protein